VSVYYIYACEDRVKRV